MRLSPVQHRGQEPLYQNTSMWAGLVLGGQVNDVREYRLQTVVKTMSAITAKGEGHSPENRRIETWRQGLGAISRHPSEVGYYVKTADLLIKLNDYEAAATLIELGLDILDLDPPPDPLCIKLKWLYERLPNRTPIDDRCHKYHQL
jgi:hypothetical protein